MSSPTMRVLCVFGPLRGQVIDVDRWSFSADATPARYVSDYSETEPVILNLVRYTVRRVCHADWPKVALLAVLDESEPSPDQLAEFYDRAVRAGCVEPETP